VGDASPPPGVCPATSPTHLRFARARLGQVPDHIAEGQGESAGKRAFVSLLAKEKRSVGMTVKPLATQLPWCLWWWE